MVRGICPKEAQPSLVTAEIRGHLASQREPGITSRKLAKQLDCGKSHCINEVVVLTSVCGHLSCITCLSKDLWQRGQIIEVS